MSGETERSLRARFADLVRLSRAERSKLLCRLDEAPGAARPSNRRVARRWQYRVARIPMTVQHPGGGGGSFVVCGRNLSTGGMSFLHGGYLHPGSEVRVLLRRWDGEPVVIDGQVARCRHVEGAVHEVGVRFAREFDLGVVLPPDMASKLADGAEPIASGMLRGTVLFADDAEVERRLMAHCLRDSGATLRTAATRGAALDIVRRERIDVVIADVNIDRIDPAGFVRALRMTGFRGAIILVTADDDARKLVRARTAGANEIIGKPYSFETLVALLSEWLAEAPLEDPVFSTLEDRPGMAEMVVDYIEQAQRRCSRLTSALADGETSECRRLASELRASGSGFGFDPVSTAARDALRALETSVRLDEAEPALRRLIALCDRLRCSMATRPPRRSPGAAPGREPAETREPPEARDTADLTDPT